MKLGKIVDMGFVGYCLENDAVAGSWCAMVRAQQAAGSRLGWCALVRAPGAGTRIFDVVLRFQGF